jgi:hypothetical protein
LRAGTPGGMERPQTMENPSAPIIDLAQFLPYGVR